MSSERLEAYEEELKELLKELQTTVSYQLPTKDGEDRRRTLKTVERKLKDAETQLRDIQTELWKAPKSYQQQALGRVARYKGDLASLRRQLTSNGLREELFQKEDEEEEDIVDLRRGEREVLLKNTETLQRASKSLHRAHQVSAQTDEITVGILEDLDDQKSSLIRTRDKVSTIDSEMDRTKSLLRTIACKFSPLQDPVLKWGDPGNRTIQNRVFLILVIFVELIILGIVVYVKFFT